MNTDNHLRQATSSCRGLDPDTGEPLPMDDFTKSPHSEGKGITNVQTAMGKILQEGDRLTAESKAKAAESLWSPDGFKK